MVRICRSAQTPCTRICQIFATIYDSIVYVGENRIKEYLFFIPLTSMQGEFFRIRYCSQELVCEAIVAPRTLPNYVEAILREQQKQKNLSELIYVESCHTTAQGRTLFLTERLTQTGLLHLVAVIAIGEGRVICFAIPTPGKSTLRWTEVCQF